MDPAYYERFWAEAQDLVQGDETAEHFYPIWVLGTTRGFRPA